MPEEHQAKELSPGADLDGDLEEEDKNLQEQYYDELADKIEFSEDEEIDEKGGMTIKNAAQYLSYKPKKKGRQTGGVDESRYFEAIARHPPLLKNDLKQQTSYRERMKLKDEIGRRKAAQQNMYSMDH